jgi:hypothetical protein
MRIGAPKQNIAARQQRPVFDGAKARELNHEFSGVAGYGDIDDDY